MNVLCSEKIIKKKNKTKAQPVREEKVCLVASVATVG